MKTIIISILIAVNLMSSSIRLVDEHGRTLDYVKPSEFSTKYFFTHCVLTNIASDGLMELYCLRLTKKTKQQQIESDIQFSK